VDSVDQWVVVLVVEVLVVVVVNHAVVVVVLQKLVICAKLVLEESPCRVDVPCVAVLKVLPVAKRALLYVDP
jgi:hypothetical protein